MVFGMVAGALGWFVAWFTFEPGFGFESSTVGGALVGVCGIIAVALAMWLLRGRPLVLAVGCVALGVGMLFVTYLLTRDIPGRPFEYPGQYGRRGDPDLYRSRIQTLWLTGISGVALCTVGARALGARTSPTN